MARSFARRPPDAGRSQPTLLRIILVAAAVAAVGLVLDLEWPFFFLLAVVLVAGLIWGRGETPARRNLH